MAAPTVEDYFDDDTDLPLPSSSKGHLPHTGMRGALVEEITSDDDFDFDKAAEQGRGEYGADSKPPHPSANKGKLVMRDEPGEMRPTSSAQQSGPKIDPNTPMGGFMGDMLKLQEAEEARIAKLRQQFGNTNIAKDPSTYKNWHSVYPRYFDAKVSVKDGRRVPRSKSLWWPQAAHIARACASLGIPSVLEPEKTHPADWENPGRVKVQLSRDGVPVNPRVQNRTQLYLLVAGQMQALNPHLVPTKEESRPLNPPPIDEAAKANKKKDKKGKGKSTVAKKEVVRHPTRAPRPPQPLPAMDDRLPLHTPVAAAGVALSALKRDLEQAKEQKKNKPIEGGEAKQPKMKRVVVRGKR